MVVQTSHHSHVDPDDPAALDHYISRMGICVEEAVIHYLLDEVVYEFAANLVQVVASCQEGFFVINRNAVDVFHDQHVGGGVFPVKDGGFYKGYVFVFAGKFLHVGGFGEEVHLFLSDTPKLFQHKVQVYGFLDGYRRKELHRFFHKADVPGHNFVDALSLNLHHYFFACL